MSDRPPFESSSRYRLPLKGERGHVAGTELYLPELIDADPPPVPAPGLGEK